MYELLWRAVLEQARIHEVIREYSCGETLHRYRFIHLERPVSNDEGVFIL